jgi:hypothetical protein
VLRMSFIGSLAPYPAIIRGAVGVSQKSKFSARVYAFTLIACSRSGHMNSLCISPSCHSTPISSAATPKIQFAQHLDGGFHLFKFSLDIEVNLLRKIDILHSIVQPTPNITQEYYGSIAVALGQRFGPVDTF